MNIINKALLWFALLPASFYRKIGVNTKHLKLILTVKLMMDDRRPNTFHQTRPKSEKVITLATFGTMLLSGFLGIFFLFSFRISDDLTTQLIVYFTLYYVMLLSTLISDFTSVLIDVRDNYIIFPKPVSDKTFVLSRLLHILMHITKIVVPMSLPAFVYLVIFNNLWSAIVFFVLVILASTFSIFLINIIYLIILKFTSPKKFQTIISYVQIFMTIVIFGGYQMMAQLTSKLISSNFIITPHLWLWILPSYWFALGFKFFTSLPLKFPLLIGAILTLLVPPLSLWAVIKYFAPSFNQKLSLITSVSEESGNASTYRIQTNTKKSFMTRLADLSIKNSVERMGFLLTWKLTGRSKDFKLKVYPSIGYFIVFGVVIVYRNKDSIVNALTGAQADSRMVVMSLVYFSSIILITSLGQIQFSEKFKAAWFYFTTPIKKPGLIFSGALKAVMVKFYLPIVLVLSLILIYFLGISIIPNIILGLLNVLLGSSLLSLVTLKNFPFSALQQTGQKIGAILRSMFSLGLVGLLGLLQAIAYKIPIVVIISILLSALANWLLLDYIKNKSWGQVLATYNE